MSFKNKLTLFVISLILGACTSINYQAKEDAIEGYTDKFLGNDTFEVTFQTYRAGNHLPQIKQFALKRAAVLSQLNHKPFFKVLSEETEKRDELVRIPEQKSLSFAGSSSTGNLASPSYQEIEMIIPAHNKKFTIQKVTLKIKLLSNYEDGAFTVSSELE